MLNIGDVVEYNGLTCSVAAIYSDCDSYFIQTQKTIKVNEYWKKLNENFMNEPFYILRVNRDQKNVDEVANIDAKIALAEDEKVKNNLDSVEIDTDYAKFPSNNDKGVLYMLEVPSFLIKA